MNKQSALRVQIKRLQQELKDDQRTAAAKNITALFGRMPKKGDIIIGKYTQGPLKVEKDGLSDWNTLFVRGSSPNVSNNGQFHYYSYGEKEGDRWYREDMFGHCMDSYSFTELKRLKMRFAREDEKRASSFEFKIKKWTSEDGKTIIIPKLSYATFTAGRRALARLKANKRAIDNIYYYLVRVAKEGHEF